MHNAQLTNLLSLKEIKVVSACSFNLVLFSPNFSITELITFSIAEANSPLAEILGAGFSILKLAN